MDKTEYTDRIDTFVKEGNYHAAVNIGLSGLNASRKENDQACIDEFLDIIKSVIQSLAEEFGSEDYLTRNQ